MLAVCSFVWFAVGGGGWGGGGGVMCCGGETDVDRTVSHSEVILAELSLVIPPQSLEPVHHWQSHPDH